jgi:TM2 domain-containing membrane protein YozV
MNCANHPDTPAVAFCRSCGKPLCQTCQRSAMGTIYCEEHYAAHMAAQQQPSSPYSSPYTADHTGAASPGLAFLLGLIPGVGAIYNGQYAKGLIHVVILGILISIVSTGTANGLEPLFGMLIGLWVIYMPFEAYHTALRRHRGESVDEFSSIVPLKQDSGLPVAPIVLIILGVIFLLNNLEIVRLYQLLRYWPVFLIVLGIYLLVARTTGGPPVAPGATPGSSPGSTPAPPPAPQEMTHER